MCNSETLERHLVSVALVKKQLKKQIKRIQNTSNILCEASQEILTA